MLVGHLAKHLYNVPLHSGVEIFMLAVRAALHAPDDPKMQNVVAPLVEAYRSFQERSGRQVEFLEPAEAAKLFTQISGLERFPDALPKTCPKRLVEAVALVLDERKH